MSVDVIGGSSDMTDVRKPVAGRPRAGSNVGHQVPLVLGPRPERVYSQEVLLKLKNHPLALLWPPYLDEAYKNARGVWDPDRWHLERKRGETPVGLEKKDGPDVGKEPAKKDKKGLAAGQDVEDLQQLVLSPQRKSFLSGCQSGSAGPGVVPPEPEVSLRPEQPGKRVGSGRILARQERERTEEDRGFRRGEEFKRFPDMRREDNKFGSGFRGARDRDDDGWGDRRDGFYQHDDRRGDNRRNDDRRPQRRRNEPEWMNETISKNDHIELVGFNDAKPGKIKDNNGPMKGNLPLSLSLGLNKNGTNGSPPELPSAGINVEDLEKGHPQLHQQQQHPRQQQKHKPGNNNDQNQNIIDNMKENKPNNIDILNDLGIASKTNDENYNFDQIMESMLGSAPEADMTPKSVPKSRFSQFFNKPSDQPQGKADSRRSSIQDELLGSNILKEINGDAPQIKIPSPSEVERYFAPISPAAQTRTNPNPLMEMITKGNMPPNQPQAAPRVQDLEENLRHQLGLGASNHHQVGQMPPHPPPQHLQDLFKAVQGHPDGPQHHPGQYRPPQDHRAQQQQQQMEPENMSAFKKLVAMVGHTSDNQAQGLPFGPSVVRPSPIPASLPSNAPTEQEILEQMMTGAAPRSKVAPPPPPPAAIVPQIPPPLANFLAGHPLNLELVSKPEGKQILLGLDSGNISIEQLVGQLSNPNSPQRQQDVILSVLKLVTMQRQGRSVGPGPARGVSPLLPGPPGHLSVSPVPQQARVPSPQEMTMLTQQIMQQALIKKKLEEQKENYRKRQADNPAAAAAFIQQTAPPASSASPLAFTPTSVMRKNAAERKDSDPQIKPVPELKITTQKETKEEPTSPGRAITKGKDDRPGSLDLAGQTRRLSPLSQQMLPPQLMQPHSNPLLYLQNNQLGPVSHSMLSQANAMAQQELAARLMAQGIDPRQLGGRLPAAPAQPGPAPHRGPVSPIRGAPPPGVPSVPGLPPQFAGFVSPQAGPGQQQGPLARFFSPEVLAAAQSGAVPAMPPMPTMSNMPQMPNMSHTQQHKVLTLEEIERQAERQAATVRM